MGFPLMLVVLLLIIGPIVLFSTFNPIKKADLITGGKLDVTFAYIDEVDHTNTTLPLFSTSCVSQLKIMTGEQYTNIGLNQHTSTTG